jgi:hypothetical protein
MKKSTQKYLRHLLSEHILDLEASIKKLQFRKDKSTDPMFIKSYNTVIVKYKRKLDTAQKHMNELANFNP